MAAHAQRVQRAFPHAAQPRIACFKARFELIRIASRPERKAIQHKRLLLRLDEDFHIAACIPPERIESPLRAAVADERIAVPDHHPAGDFIAIAFHEAVGRSFACARIELKQRFRPPDAHQRIAAAAGLQELVTRVPLYLPALMRLIDVCVDGALEATMHAAQAQLTDAYLEAGAPKEARFLAEELVAREPWDRGHIERFRRSLEMLGEPDPNAVIAARLSGDSPFTSTDESIAGAIFTTRLTSVGREPASWPVGDQPEAAPPSIPA